MADSRYVKGGQFVQSELAFFMRASKFRVSEFAPTGRGVCRSGPHERCRLIIGRELSGRLSQVILTAGSRCDTGALKMISASRARLRTVAGPTTAMPSIVAKSSGCGTLGSCFKQEV